MGTTQKFYWTISNGIPYFACLLLLMRNNVIRRVHKVFKYLQYQKQPNKTSKNKKMCIIMEKSF